MAGKPGPVGPQAPQLLIDLRRVYAGESTKLVYGKRPKRPARLTTLDKMKKDDPAAFIRMLNDNEEAWQKTRIQLLSLKPETTEVSYDDDECLALVEKLIEDYMKEHPEAK